ncbi:DUF4097 family beta strand repeat-containing protein [Kibdelosporangium philippinense]|uniref:DUF4097 family beta strand repeat-containing protein n=1 Tax=Kibdelosporangium philippinense TaxID=211113 RepID=A0ABS8ZDH5_9PSEU|nr:DUF4097 family beta strand repeat-containing protein [Kibdelosporangium philippinense]MCE7004721.1 DUF4097 family beta strand repeat-containing protein [Kibdelosporangium philippinense]
MPTFATPGPITATLSTGGAKVRLAASERPDTVVLVEPIDSENKTDLKVAEKTKVEFAEGELKIETVKAGDKNGSVAITIELPVGSKLVLETAWSDIQASGALGDCAVDLASGQVKLDHVANLHGHLSTGEVEVAHVAGTVSIEGGAAGVRIGAAEGVVKYQGSTGKVWIGHGMSDIDLSGSGGSFDIDRADGNVIAKAADCPIRVGRITQGQAVLMNAAGGIEVGISEGTAAWVDAKSTKGTVRSSLPAQDALDEFDNKVEVYARTRLNDIVIQRATG